MRNLRCVLCGIRQKLTELYPATFSIKDLTASVYSARRVPDRVHYRMVKCERCGVIFSTPILSFKKINQLYYKSECTYAQQVPYTTRTYMQLFNRLPALIAHPKVLEVGCGNGFFLRALKQQGADVWGVEPGKKMLASAPAWLRRRVVVDVFRKGLFPARSFDVVCCFHTLDHLVDPNGFVREASSLLKPGGRILIVVHDTLGLSVRFMGERSPIFDIEHIYLFNKKNLRMLFERHGFKVKSVFDVVNTYPLWYWMQMSGLPRVLKMTGDAISRLFKLDKMPISLAGGNIGMVAQKKDAE